MTQNNLRLNISRWKTFFASFGITCFIFLFYGLLLALPYTLQETFKTLGFLAEFQQSEMLWSTFAVLVAILAAPVTLLTFYFFVKYVQRRRLKLAFHFIKEDHVTSLLKNFSIHFGLLFVLGIVMTFWDWQNLFDIPVQELEGIFFAPLLWFLLLVVAVPIFEEVLFRGFFYARLRQVFKFWPAFFFSGLFFSLLHIRPELTLLSNIYIVSNILLLAYFITKTFEESNNLWMPILFHVLHNGRVLLILLVENIS